MSAQPLKLLSSNIQAGSVTRAYSEYVTRSWSQIFHAGKQGNLDALAQTFQTFDLVGLQECDPGRNVDIVSAEIGMWSCGYGISGRN